MRRGSDLAAEGEGGDRAAEGFAQGGGYDVLVFFGGDSGEVGGGGVLAECRRSALVADQFAELGRPADLAFGLPAGQVLGGVDRAGVDLEGMGEVVVGADLDLDRES